MGLFSALSLVDKIDESVPGLFTSYVSNSLLLDRLKDREERFKQNGSNFTEFASLCAMKIAHLFRIFQIENQGRNISPAELKNRFFETDFERQLAKYFYDKDPNRFQVVGMVRIEKNTTPDFYGTVIVVYALGCNVQVDQTQNRIRKQTKVVDDQVEQLLTNMSNHPLQESDRDIATAQPGANKTLNIDELKKAMVSEEKAQTSETKEKTEGGNLIWH